MLMRTDPFRELDRFAQQAFGTVARPAIMPMDAWREGDEFVVEFDGQFLKITLPDNVAAFQINVHESSFLAGVVAGSLTKSKTVGAVVGGDAP